MQQSPGSGNDNLFLGIFDDYVETGANQDKLFGGQGNDHLKGGSGNDLLRGDAGDDIINGGVGIDRAIFTGVVNTTVRLSVTGSQTTGHGNDQLIGIENVTTAGGNDQLAGNGKNNILVSRGGSDILNGAAGNDTLKAGAGRDVLNGGLGDDILRGGSGGDSFIYQKNGGTDRIFGFKNNVDELRLDDSLWGGGMTVNQVISTFGEVVSGDFFLDFGSGNVLILEDFSRPNALKDDIIFI